MGSETRAFNVLIVEDQAVIAFNVEDVVRSLGAYTVGCAATVSDALTLIETARWDAALLDIKLAHGQTAYPIAERLQAKGIPFAFATGWGGDIDPRYSAVPLLKKPFGHEDLEACLAMLLGKVPAAELEQRAA